MHCRMTHINDMAIAFMPDALVQLFYKVNAIVFNSYTEMIHFLLFF